MAIIQALAFMIGMGTGNFIARMIGAGNRKLAEELASIAFFTGFGVGLVIAVIGNANIGQLVRMLGSTETIAPYAEAYASYIFVAAPFMICSFIMNNLLRFQGKALFAMVGITTGGVLNMVLDPIFIFGLDMGQLARLLLQGFPSLSASVSCCLCVTPEKNVFPSTRRNSNRHWQSMERSSMAACLHWDVRGSPVSLPLS